jgi:hypothetical protein
LKSVGVKLFRGIVGGGEVPIGLTEMFGVMILIIVPGVVAGIVELFAGMNTTGICRPVGSRLGSVTSPAPVEGSLMVVEPAGGKLLPAPITLTGPKQI